MKTEEVKNRYFNKVSIEALHKECQTWISGFNFWKDEVRFMHDLINKNFVYFVAKDKYHSLQALLEKITEIEIYDLEVLKKGVIQHEHRLVEFLKRGLKPDMEKFLIEHINLLNDVERFQNNYRILKTEMFRMAEEVIKTKKQKQVLN